jgi:hypothetical protein
MSAALYHAQSGVWVVSSQGTPPPSGEVRYLRPTGGSNLNDGLTWATAWATSEYAATNAPAGSTILVDGVVVPASGALQSTGAIWLNGVIKSSAIVFDAYSPGSFTIRGNGAGTGVAITGCSRIEIRNAKLDGIFVQIYQSHHIKLYDVQFLRGTTGAFAGMNPGMRVLGGSTNIELDGFSLEGTATPSHWNTQSGRTTHFVIRESSSDIRIANGTMDDSVNTDGFHVGGNASSANNVTIENILATNFGESGDGVTGDPHVDGIQVFGATGLTIARYRRHMSQGSSIRTTDAGTGVYPELTEFIVEHCVLGHWPGTSNPIDSKQHTDSIFRYNFFAAGRYNAKIGGSTNASCEVYANVWDEVNLGQAPGRFQYNCYRANAGAWTPSGTGNISGVDPFNYFEDATFLAVPVDTPEARFGIPITYDYRPTTDAPWLGIVPAGLPPASTLDAGGRPIGTTPWDAGAFKRQVSEPAGPVH